MKILIIRNYPSYMDVERNTYNIQEVGLAKALIRKGEKCDIVFWTDKEEKVITLPVGEYGCITVFYKNGKTLLKNTIYKNCDDLFKQYDILQTAEYNQIESWILANKYPNKVIVYHGPYFATFNKRYNLMCTFFDFVFLKRYLKLNTKFITKSMLAKKFLETKGIKEHNIATVGVGMDAQMLSNERHECYEPIYLSMKHDDSIKLLYIGRFEKRRNVTFIMDILSAILKNYENVTLYMIGVGKREYLAKCWKYADMLNVQQHIVYQEQIEQKYLSSIYELSDFFILPTEYEIFGMVLLEAMYYKNIVITTYNGGSDTLIRDEENGFIIDRLEKSEWAGKICSLIQDKTKADQVKNNAHETIANLYTWDKLADAFIKNYRKINDD